MGGYGSTRWGWHTPRPTIGSRLELAIGTLHDLLAGDAPGVCQWSRDGKTFSEMVVTPGPRGVSAYRDKAGAWTSGREVELAYQVKGPDSGEGQNVKCAVYCEATPMRFGGTAWRFRCPWCRRAARALYLDRSRFVCRRCAGLAYQVQRESAEDRAFRRVQKLAKRLGWTEGLAPADTLEMPEWVPPRPKGMRRHTYERLAEQWEDSCARHADHMVRSLARITRRWY